MDVVTYFRVDSQLREKDWAASFFAASTWTGSDSGADVTPGTKWNATGGTPVADIQNEKMSILSKTGYMPNVLVCGSEAYSTLINADDVVDRIKYTQRGVLGPDLLAGVLGVDKVYVMYAGENTAAEGQAATNAFIGTKDNALLCYAAKAPSLLHASAGYTFTWSGYTGAQDGQRISRFRMDHLRADRVEGELAYDQKLISADLGAFFTDVSS